MNLTLPMRGMTQGNVTQTYHAGHKALDIIGNKVNFGYGTPLCAMENSLVLSIKGEGFTPDDHTNAKHGYGISLKGLETGHQYLYWHCLPYFPVNGGDTVKRGQIVAYMGNAGYVTVGGIQVPIEKRTQEPYLGTHLHLQMDKDGERVNPLNYFNWQWQPQYTTADFIKALMAVVKKISTITPK